MYPCVLFDVDNTLLLKKPTIPEAVFSLAAQENPALEMEDVEKAYAASELWQGGQIQKENQTGVRMPDDEYLQNVANIYRQTLGLTDETCQALVGLFGRGYHQEYRLMPGARELLRALQGQGARLGVVSNNHSGVRRVLADMGLAPFFSCMVISEEVGLYKPDPRILELACAKLGVPCGEAAYLGDHPFDVLCAHSAGMAAIWMPANRFMELPAGISPPECTVPSLSQALKALLEKEG